MTLQVGDKVVTLPLRDGGRVTVRSGTISVGDKAVLIPGANGQIYAVKPASPQVGDKVILYPLRNGGHVCLASADDEGGSSPSVMPPGNFSAVRTGPSAADLDWLPGEGNTAVRIVRRPDRYPVHINDGTVVYESAGSETTDAGLDYRLPYYYCAWGKAGSTYSNGYLMTQIPKWYGSQSNPTQICEAWVRGVSTQYEEVSYPITWGWDGQGSVYVSSSQTTPGQIAIDDVIDVSASGGTVSQEHGGTGDFLPALNITPILNPGTNSITVTIRDVYAGEIGTATSLYIMRSLS